MLSLKPSPRALALIASVLVLSLSAGYIALAWTEPTGTMPVTVAAPLNTGTTAQTKEGALTIQGNLTAPIFYDANDPTYYVNPAGQTMLGGNIQLTGNIVKTTGYLYLSGLNGNVFIRGTGTNQGIRLDGTSQFIQAYAPVTGVESNLFLNPNGGTVGIGTISPTNGAKLHILQGSYGYQDSVVESALPSIRLVDSENNQAAFGFLADGSNLYLDAYTYANRFANSYGTHIMTVQSDGKITINNSGQLCIGATCANSTTWNTMVNNASGGGSGGQTFTAAPIVLFSDGFEDGTLAPFTTTADTGYVDPWAIASDQKSSGTYSAKAGKVLVVFNDRYSNISMPAVTVGPGGGQIKFSTKYSYTRWYSGLEFYDGTTKLYSQWNAEGCPSGSDGTGNCNWDTLSFPLSPGSHNFTWRFHTYAGYSSNLWIDDVEVIEYQPAVTINGNISLNGNLIHTGSSAADCYVKSWNVYEDVSCLKGYVLTGFKAGGGGSGREIETFNCCRP